MRGRSWAIAGGVGCVAAIAACTATQDRGGNDEFDAGGALDSTAEDAETADSDRDSAGGDAGTRDAADAWSLVDAPPEGAPCDASCVDPNWADWPMPNGPVDSPPAPNRESYTDNHDGTVTDDVTGLMWQQTVATSTFTWGSASTSGTAQSYCATLSLAAHTDWRLPALIELVSIVDLSVQNPSIDVTYFPGTPSQFFWSATPVAGSPGDVWYVGFGDGATNSPDVSNDNYVRCVR